MADNHDDREDPLYERDQLQNRYDLQVQANATLLGLNAKHIERETMLREALAELWSWVSRMPDAGLNDSDPRWYWWNEGVGQREKARNALGEE